MSPWSKRQQALVHAAVGHFTVINAAAPSLKQWAVLPTPGSTDQYRRLFFWFGAAVPDVRRGISSSRPITGSKLALFCLLVRSTVYLSSCLRATLKRHSWSFHRVAATKLLMAFSSAFFLIRPACRILLSDELPSIAAKQHQLAGEN